MEWHLPLSSLPALLSAVLLTVLTVVVLRFGRGRRDVVALALLMGAAAGASAFVFTFDGFAGTYATSMTVAITQAFWMMDAWLWACFAMMLLAERTEIPRLLRAFPTYLVPAFGLATLVIWKPELVYDYSAFLSTRLVVDADPGSFPLGHPRALSIVDRVTDAASPLFAFALAWWALRREQTELWSSILLIALAAAGVRLFDIGNTLTGLAGRPLDPWWSAIGAIFLVALTLCLAVVALLLHAAFRGREDRRRFARNGAGFLLLLGASGVLVSLIPTTPLVFSFFLTFATLTFPLVATYALLRHRLLGLEVKLRFAISRSTIAAAFITVFFIVSEGAQILFGADNEWLGLLAAGALVFAFAPLQRAAERLAEKAVPLTSTQPSMGDDKEEAYRRALRLALRDRSLTRDEERDLFVIAGELGLTPVRAFELRDEMERAKEAKE